MAVHLPSKIRFEPKKSYGVSFVSSFDTESQVGSCDPNTLEIKVKLNQTDKHTVGVLLHEIIHMISFERDLSITENQCEALEVSLIKIFELNPSFLTLLYKTFKKR